MLLKAIILGDARLVKYQPDSWFGDLLVISWSKSGTPFWAMPKLSVFPSFLQHKTRWWCPWIMRFTLRHAHMLQITLHASKQDQEEQLYQIYVGEHHHIMWDFSNMILKFSKIRMAFSYTFSWWKISPDPSRSARTARFPGMRYSEAEISGSSDDPVMFVAFGVWWMGGVAQVTVPVEFWYILMF